MSCRSCARRAHLLAQLGVALDFRARDPERLWKVLELPDELLINALAGRNREQLHVWHASLLEGDEQPLPVGVEKICRHNESFPSILRSDMFAPRELQVVGGVDRLLEILKQPVVAIVGSRRCTDYGIEIARALARDLTYTGVSLLSELSPGIARSAHTGALEVDGAAIALMSGGLDKCPEPCVPVYRRLNNRGCFVSELPWGTSSRRWSELARLRTLVPLAELVIVVEAENNSWELAAATLARTLGKKLAAVPGRVTSSTSEGTNRLLREGAELVRTAEDALGLLYGINGERCLDKSKSLRLAPRLQEVLWMIGGGKDTISKLDVGRADKDTLLLELAELELKGLVQRGDGGRYVPCAVTAYK